MNVFLHCFMKFFLHCFMKFFNLLLCLKGFLYKREKIQKNKQIINFEGQCLNNTKHFTKGYLEFLGHPSMLTIIFFC